MVIKRPRAKYPVVILKKFLLLLVYFISLWAFDKKKYQIAWKIIYQSHRWTLQKFNEWIKIKLLNITI